MWNHLRSGIVGGIVAGAVILAGSAVAGSGIGGVFNLGQSNTVNASSALSGATAGKQLIVANLGTAGSSSALLGYAKGTSPAATFQNAGAGPAVSLLAGAGQPPFTTNSAYHVANLNADKLDGLDASAFAQGPGTQHFARREVIASGGSAWIGFLTVPGLGNLLTGCFSGPNGGASVLYSNDTSHPVDFWSDKGVPAGYQSKGQVMPGSQNSGIEVALGHPGGLQAGATVGLGHGGDSPGPIRSATVHIFALQGGQDYPCGIQIQVTEWTAP